MCSAKPKSQQLTMPKINGRPVLQPTCNRVSSLERRNSLKKSSTKSPANSPPVSPKLPSPRPPAIKRGKDVNDTEKALNTITPLFMTKAINEVKKSKKSSAVVPVETSLLVETPGSIAAARREQVATMQEQRKMKIAHYGRTKSAKFDSPLDAAGVVVGSTREQKRCSYITPNSDPIYVAYHDEEWGVPVHDDKLLFELLLLTGAQVGSDWTSVLKKRQTFREAFSGFDAEVVAKYSEKKIKSINTEYNIELSLIRGVVDNAGRILEIKKEMGSLEKYLWGFVNHKPISTQYKLCQKIPVKTSKSESISKDMVRRGFRFVGPTVIHSLMEAAGLTNNHLVTCPRHLQCIALASKTPSLAPTAQ
ncbi:uncharacterized protein LOC133800695 [Humulus lupulus]|uniref:uncharacterized protein LOC133800695 n=1 Tax=Humulus lupulus TaxID=3486 RepID=UPI002B413962|nr:uncharacterized protein LOC133800695 [Humulus lupulus]